jgi:cysteinyl-tRNA synthetase
VEPDKRDPADFALWKAAGEGRILRWDTPRWGAGFPGWHLECSAMAMRYLGDRFDIHSGGIDNIFPHHEDEIAQSAPVVGGVPSTHWVHGEHLLMGGHKMAKSAGNFQRVTELADRGLDPLAFRYLVLTSRYGRKLNYTDTSVAAAAAGLDSLRARLRALGAPPSGGPWASPARLHAGAAGDRPEGIVAGPLGHGRTPAGATPAADGAHTPSAPLSEAGRGLHDRYVSALDDDLDLPTALAVVREALRADLSADERRWLVLDADRVLGLDLDLVWANDPAAGGADAGQVALPDDVQALIEARTRARDIRDWAAADAAREALTALGWDVVDRPDGPIVRPAPGSGSGE